MQYCSKCGKEIQDNKENCSYCGTQVANNGMMNDSQTRGGGITLPQLNSRL